MLECGSHLHWWCFFLFANLHIYWCAQAHTGVHCNLHSVVVLVMVVAVCLHVCACVCVYAGVRVCMHCVQYVCAVFVVLVLYIVYSADVCAWGKQTTKVPGK